MSTICDIAIVIVSANDARWLQPCLSTVFSHAGTACLEVVVVDNESTDDTSESVSSSFPQVRVISSKNHGFGYGNNRGLETTSARYILFLNPDTEIVQGTFGELVSLMDARPDVGLAGARQIAADDTLWPTMRRFPSVSRALGEALFSEHWPISPAWAGERVLSPDAYEREQKCDWTSGSFMLVRREALRSAGVFDERFFLFSEEPDLCLRIERAGWQVRHLPQMTIIHHAGKGGIRPRMVAQDAYARKQYALKHFGTARRRLYLGALGVRHLVRAMGIGSSGSDGATQRESARRALSVLAGLGGPPFRTPPATALDCIPATDQTTLSREQQTVPSP